MTLYESTEKKKITFFTAWIIFFYGQPKWGEWRQTNAKKTGGSKRKIAMKTDRDKQGETTDLCDLISNQAKQLSVDIDDDDFRGGAKKEKMKNITLKLQHRQAEAAEQLSKQIAKNAEIRAAAAAAKDHLKINR